jgi:hypothetical protein
MLYLTEEIIDEYCKNQGWKRTGVKVSEHHFKLCEKWGIEYQETPIIKVNGVWMNEVAEEEFKQKITELALSYGLPPLAMRDGEKDHYGLMINREFVTLA